MSLTDDNGEYSFPFMPAGTVGAWAFYDDLIPSNGFTNIAPDDSSILNLQIQ
jgi:hypothetical protein